MPDIADAETWANLEALDGPVLAYADGSVSRWPPEAFTALGGRVAGHITVLADERYAIFDSEKGNAGTEAVAAAVANRLGAKRESTCYTNEENLPALTKALQGKGIHWTDAQFWPEPGCYLWAAAPGTTPGSSPSWCPVSPVAVQDRWVGPYDLSTTFQGWPASIMPEPAPTPLPVKAGDMFVMVRDPVGHVITFDGSHWFVVTDTASMAAFGKAGIPVVNVTEKQFQHITTRKI